MTTHHSSNDGSAAPANALLSGRKGYVLFILFLVYTFNYVDRQVLVILAQPIKLEFGLKDWQIGFLTGTAFALFYATLGMPIARLADRSHRVNIIAISLTLWSAMTAVCAATTSFVQLAFARVGVGIGEAGGSPPALSLISSYFDRGQRATAMGVYSLGPTVGILLGFVVGGWVNARYGWRAAMLAAGLPGLLLAALVKLTIPEPRSAPGGGGEQLTEAQPPFWSTVRTLFAVPCFTLLNVATVAAGISLFGFMVWVPVFLIREFSLSTREVGTVVGLCAGLAGSIGVFGGGWLSDRLSKRDHRWQLRVPGLTTLAFWPLVLLVINAGSKQTAFMLLVPTYMFALAYTGPSWAVLQSIVPANMRAMAAAILLFLVNLVGLALGPQLVGLMSDVFQGHAEGVGGLRLAISIVSVGSLIATVLFFLGSKALKAESSAAP